METPIIFDCMESSNNLGDFTHISDDMKNNLLNSTNSTNQKLKIDIGNDKILEFDKFNLTEISTCKNNILIFGKREYGAIFLIHNIIEHMDSNNMVDAFVIFTHKYNIQHYANFCKSKYSTIDSIFETNSKNDKFHTIISPDDFDDKDKNRNIKTMIENILFRQKQMLEKGTNGRRLMIIFDDYFDDVKLSQMMANDKIFNELMFNSRQYNIGIIMKAQSPLRIKPEIRCQMDFLIVCREEYISNQKRLYELYFGIFPTFKLFNKVMRSLDDYKWIVFHQSSNEDLLTKVKYYYSITNQKNSNDYKKLHN